jgi:hypothetical protein
VRGIYATGFAAKGVSVCVVGFGDVLWDATRVVRLGIDGCVLIAATTEMSLSCSGIVASIVEEMLI